MLWPSVFNFILIILTCCLSANSSSKTESTSKEKRSTPELKSDRDRALLKAVADKIYVMIKQPNFNSGFKGPREEESDKSLFSAISMFTKNDGQLASIESTARIMEVLTHLIAETSEQIRQQDIEVSKIEGKRIEDIKLDTPLVKKMPEAKVVVKSSMPSLLHNSKISPIQSQKPLFDGKLESKNDLSFDKPLQPSIDPVAKVDEEPTVKLRTHVVLTDNVGREFHLVGVGKREEPNCGGGCIALDKKSKEVLTFNKPVSNDYLVLSDKSGKKFYTSGIQLCNVDDETISETNPMDLSLLTPAHKRAIKNLKYPMYSPDKFYGKWEDDKGTSLHKRENYVNNDYMKDLNKFFNGNGMRNSNQATKEDKLLPRRRRSRMLRRRQRHHARSRSNRNSDKEEIDKNLNLNSEKSAKTEDVNDKCKEGCLVERDTRLKRSIDNFAPLDVPLEEHSQQKRRDNSNLFDLFNKPKSLNQDLEGLSKTKLDEGSTRSRNEIKVLAIGPVKSEIIVPPDGVAEGDEEINMIQPSSKPNEEMLVLMPPVTPQDSLSTESVMYIEPPTTQNMIALLPSVSSKVEQGLTVDTYLESLSNNSPGPAGAPDVQDLSSLFDSAESGEQFLESIMFRVQNMYELKHILGSAIYLSSPKTLLKPQKMRDNGYRKSLNILMKTLLINIERIADEEASRRSCPPLEKELQVFLSSLLGVPVKNDFVDVYQPNISPSESLENLIFKRNELIDLLSSYNKLTPEQQESIIGLKSYIDSELANVEERIEDEASNVKYPQHRSPIVRETAAWNSAVHKRNILDSAKEKINNLLEKTSNITSSWNPFKTEKPHN